MKKWLKELEEKIEIKSQSEEEFKERLQKVKERNEKFNKRMKKSRKVSDTILTKRFNI
ncbi:MAG: hypothetical protein ACOCT9_01890 [archaeon]